MACHPGRIDELRAGDVPGFLFDGTTTAIAVLDEAGADEVVRLVLAVPMAEPRAPKSQQE